MTLTRGEITSIVKLDWEGEQNSAFGRADVSWCRSWCKRVKDKTGVTPGIYMSKSVCRQHDWSKLEDDYPLWCAQYANDSKTGYQTAPWTDAQGFGAWKSATIYQYSSHGRLSGWNGNLDLDIAYLTKTEWQAMASVTVQVSDKSEKTTNETVDRWIAILAVKVMKGDYKIDPDHKKLLGDDYDAVMDLINAAYE